MKSVWKSVVVIVLFSAALYWAGNVYGNISEDERAAALAGVSADGAAQADPADNWAAPDVEYLAYYGLEPFETKFPVVYISTGGQRISKENKIWASMAVLNADPDGAPQSIMAVPDYQEAITIKYRGASSYSGFDKRQFRIKFYEHEGSAKAEELPFLGMGKSSEWILNGPFLDKTLMRNRLIYGLGREMFEWAPDTRYVEVFLDGKYLGVYLAVEPVTNGTSRLRLSEFGFLSGETAYIVKRDRIGTEDDPLSVYGKINGKTNNDLYVEYPSQKNRTPLQTAWITADISAFEKALYGDDFDDPNLGYEKYIDMDCFADYFILNEVVMNNDAGNLSTYPYKELGGKLKMAIWDYNNCYDNYQWFAQDFSEFFSANNAWFSRLLQDRAFVDKVMERYGKWRKTVLSTDHMYEQIDRYRQELGDAVDRNFAVWGYTFDINLMGDYKRDLTSYDAAVAQLKGAIEKRFQFLDNHITDLYQYCIN